MSVTSSDTQQGLGKNNYDKCYWVNFNIYLGKKITLYYSDKMQKGVFFILLMDKQH